ncbi:MAG TPA: hypothetical protein IAC53_03340 [Candidatus Fimenecus excrementigallinarum]|uniref:Uncharacterized protein n=1 Tax=Candidatus Fimenecus excrementigallinarum TaxID=2840816 RepID=A0A9D1IEU0_9FIRM|nr:hypothetical protein [Candidatus Fimenecus excrementigallinarum]
MFGAHGENGIAPKCAYCRHGTLSADKTSVLCKKRGVVSPDGRCRKYKYDILKRQPPHRQKPPAFSEADFEL